MAKYRELRERVEQLLAGLTPATLEREVRVLLAEGEDAGGGVNAFRLVKRLLGSPNLSDVETVWAYDQLKPLFRRAFEQIPTLYYFAGD